MVEDPERMSLNITPESSLEKQSTCWLGSTGWPPIKGTTRRGFLELREPGGTATEFDRPGRLNGVRGFFMFGFFFG